MIHPFSARARARSQSSAISLKASPKVTPMLAAGLAHPLEDAVAEGLELLAAVGVVDGHGGHELAAVLEQSRDLGGLEAGDVLDVVGLVGLEQQQPLGPVVGEALIGEEERVAGGHDAVDAPASRRGGDPGAVGSAATDRGPARPRASSLRIQ